MNQSDEVRLHRGTAAMCLAILGLAVCVVPLLASAKAVAAKPPTSPIARLSAKVESLAQASKSRVYEIPMGFAVVGNTAYRTIYEIRIDPRDPNGDGGSIRSLLVADDLGTGLRRRLYVKRNVMLFGLAAAGNRLYGLAYHAVNRKREEIRLLDFSADPATPRLVYREEYKSFTSTLTRLAGVTTQGEAILVQPYLGSTCGFDWFWEEGTWTDCAHLVAVGPDGAKRPLAEYVDSSTPVIATGDRLIFQRGFRIVAVRPDGAETDLWEGDFTSIDVSTAGDAIVSWSTGGKTDDQDEPDSIGSPPSTPGATGTAGATGPTGGDFDAYAPASGIARVPLGEPASAQLPLIDSDGETSTAIACGVGIVRLVARAGDDDELRGFAAAMATIVVAPSGKVAEAIGGAVGVELRSSSGEFIRTLGTIKADLIGEPLCNGGQVVIPYVAYTRNSATWGPSRYGVFDAK